MGGTISIRKQIETMATIESVTNRCNKNVHLGSEIILFVKFAMLKIKYCNQIMKLYINYLWLYKRTHVFHKK